MSSKVLQTPQIIGIEGSTIKIAHPDISDYTRTEVTSPLTAAGTTLTIADNNNFEDNDWFILGEVGDSKTEECDVNGAVTRGTSLTITNTTKFSHGIHTPTTRIFERRIAIYGAATDGGTGTLITSIDALTNDAFDIQWDKKFSEWTLITTDTAYAYYYAVFNDGTTDSSASDYVLAAGTAYNSAQQLIDDGLKYVNATIDNDMISKEWLLSVFNDWQDEITNFSTKDGVSKDWSFEIDTDNTSIAVTQNENEYDLTDLSFDLKYPKTVQPIFAVKLGADIINYLDYDEMDELYNGKKRTEVSVEASAANTSITLDDVAEFADDGSAYVGSDTITYTDRNTTTNVLSGIPASGTGSITETWAVDTVVWQSISPGKAERYSVFNGILTLSKPPNSDTAGKKLKVKALKKLPRITAYSETTEITATHTAKMYIGSRIESRKGNTNEAVRLLDLFKFEVQVVASKDKLPITEEFEYYRFDDYQYIYGSRGRRDDSLRYNT